MVSASQLLFDQVAITTRVPPLSWPIAPATSSKTCPIASLVLLSVNQSMQISICTSTRSHLTHSFKETVSNMIRIAYIDSEMAKRRQNEYSSTNTNNSSAVIQSTHQSQPLSKGIPAAITSQQHQLTEVDLASIPIPTRAPSKLAPLRPPRKPRLGRDGKPLRPRPRKRRNSEDVARDALVEQVLHEHKLVDMSQSSGLNSDPQAHSDSEEAATGGAKASGDTDEAFAERFRQNFLDRVAERQLAQQQKKSAPGTATVEKGQGPRLGGSRSARAKMAAMQQQQGPAGQK
jgi:hypothetical protein